MYQYTQAFCHCNIREFFQKLSPLSESFPPLFRHFDLFVSRNFSILHIFPVFFPNILSVKELDIFSSSGENSRIIVTERLRILIHISNNFQTLEINYGKNALR